MDQTGSLLKKENPKDFLLKDGIVYCDCKKVIRSKNIPNKVKFIRFGSFILLLEAWETWKSVDED